MNIDSTRGITSEKLNQRLNKRQKLSLVARPHPSFPDRKPSFSLLDCYTYVKYNICIALIPKRNLEISFLNTAIVIMNSWF